MNWNPSVSELVNALNQRNWSVHFSADDRGQECQLCKGDILITTYGATRLSALWAGILEAIKMVGGDIK